MSAYVVLSTLHLLGIDIALGACTVTYAVAFFGLIKPEFMKKSVPLFWLFSLLIWVGWFVIAASGVALCFQCRDLYGENIRGAAFYSKVALTVLAALNGLFLSFIVTPAFEKAVHLADFSTTAQYRRAVALGMIGGGVSFTCWYGSFFLGVYIFRVLGG